MPLAPGSHKSIRPISGRWRRNSAMASTAFEALGDESHIRLRSKNGTEAFAKNRMVFDAQDANGPRKRRHRKHPIGVIVRHYGMPGVKLYPTPIDGKTVSRSPRLVEMGSQSVGFSHLIPRIRSFAATHVTMISSIVIRHHWLKNELLRQESCWRSGVSRSAPSNEWSAVCVEIHIFRRTRW
jgi:hypothetical protein